MNEPIEQREALWDKFLQRWPLEQLPSLTLDSYNHAGSDDSFCRWVEKHLETLGSIWGGSSLKFGIYSRANAEKDPSGQHGVTANERYAWYSRYGQSEDEAFTRVRGLIVATAQAAREGRLEAIEDIDLWPILKWKIAFLYQNRQQPTVLPIYLRKYLAAAMDGPAPKRHSEIYRALLSQRGGESLLTFADHVYERGQVVLQHEQRMAVLNHFSAAAGLAARLEASQATSAFCDLALALHEQGLDWWITETRAIHAGRTEEFRLSQVALALQVDVGAELVRVCVHGAGDEHWQPLDEALVDSLIETVERNTVDWPKSARSGYWPDDYDNMADRLVITLTDVAIRNGYLTVPKVQRLFPDVCLGDIDQPAPQLFTLRLPDGSSLQTQVLKQHKQRIQARFHALFAAEHLQAGDQAVLTQVADFIYQLSFRRVGQSAPPVVAEIDSQNTEIPMGHVPLNQILFGPPGTGKTYATIEAALAVLDPDCLEAQRDHRVALKQRFDELVAQDRIRFVTFHQSYSYEDFVEGLRATTDEASGQLRYEVVDGVFKSLSEAAAAKVTQQAEAPTEIGQRRIWKMSLGNTLGEDAGIYQECLAGGYVLLGYGGAIDFSGCTSREQVQERFAQAGITPEKPATDYGITSVTAFVTRMKIGDLIVVSDGNFKFRAIGEVSGDYQFKSHPDFPGDYSQMRPVKWLRQYQPSLPHTELLNGQFSQMTLYELRSPTLDGEKLKSLLSTRLQTGAEDGARVLIIDEINRGNISRIFGELITLIEPSKRAGAEEALSVVLPYSKQSFSVPNNVYLIGTMNTADRSLAGLDIALRRRFVFKEMPPRPELLDDVDVSGINIGELLRVMNQRIEVLLDRDHCLGHAYLMPLKTDSTLARLEAIFRNQLLPLLQEYFFEDWERIGWVLNDPQAVTNGTEPFIRRPHSERSLAALFGSQVAEKLNDQRWELNDAAFGMLASYQNILG